MKLCEKVLAGLLAAVICVGLLGGCSREEPEETVPVETLPVSDWTQVVARYGDHELDNAMLSYYYWTSYASFLTYYESDTQYLLDLYTPLDEQYYSDGVTWQDYFIDNALMAFRQYTVLCDLAKESGFTLSETAQETLANVEERLTETAQLMGFETAEEYLHANYGSGANLENYAEYMEQQFIAQEYTASVQNEKKYTDDEVSAYFDQNEKTYLSIGITKDERTMKEVRYLMIHPTEATEAAFEEIDAVFNQLRAEWDASDDHSEAAFMALGEKWYEQGITQDYLPWTSPGKISFDGMEDWLFNEPRAYGDTRAVYVDTGDYLFFYLGDTGETYWYHQAYYDMCYAEFMAFLNEKMDGYSYETWEDRIVLAQPLDMYTE